MKDPTRVKSPRVRRKRVGQFHHGDLAEQLALAAADLVERKGHHALTMKDLAARLGVSDAAIYRHYAGRAHMLPHAHAETQEPHPKHTHKDAHTHARTLVCRDEHGRARD